MSTSSLSPHHTSRSPSGNGGDPIVIALVNNMSDAALQTTERQFRDLFAAAGGSHDIRLRLFSFPELKRGEAARAYIADQYEPIDGLWSERFDGIIVTGAEPRAAALPDEAYWGSLTRLVDWADEAATSTVWSCLAAHAAVLYLDGVERRRYPEKLSGVFPCVRVAAHPLLAGMPSVWCLPHSRYNTLDPSALAAAGYEVLSWSDDAGPDTFILRRGTLFVFYQGHPEYDPGALFREYRRDVGRFLAGTMDRYPEMPRGYFDDDIARAFEAFRARAHRQRSRELLEEFPGGTSWESATRNWHDDAVRLYANWLAYLAANRSPRVAAEAGDFLPAPTA